MSRGYITHPEAIRTGLVAEYKVNTYSVVSGEWNDTTANRINATGTVTNFPQFNGTTEFIAIGNPIQLDFATTFTIELWSNQDSSPPTQGTECLVSKDSQTLGRNITFTRTDNTGQYSAIAWLPAITYTQGNHPKDLNYHHSVFVNEGPGGDTRLYLDGVLVTTTVGAGGSANWSANVPWEIGRSQGNNMGIPDDYLTGMIDTIRFYDRPIGPDEVMTNYRVGIADHGDHA